MEIINGIFSESFWWVAPILVTMTTALAGLINQGFKVPYAWLKQLISWVLGAGLACGAWGLKLITFGDPVWLGVVSLCLVVGLSSNGIYDIPTIKNWINTWFVKTPSGLNVDNNLVIQDAVLVTEEDLKSAPIVVAEYKDEATKATIVEQTEVKVKTKTKAKAKPKRKPKPKVDKTETPVENA